MVHNANTHTHTHLSITTHIQRWWCCSSGARTSQPFIWNIIISTIWRHWQFNIRLENDLYRKTRYRIMFQKPLRAKTFKWLVFRMNFSLSHLMSSDSLRVDNFIHCFVVAVLLFFLPLTPTLVLVFFPVNGMKIVLSMQKEMCQQPHRVSCTLCLHEMNATSFFFLDCLFIDAFKWNLILQRHIFEVCNLDNLTEFPTVVGFFFSLSSNFGCFVADDVKYRVRDFRTSCAFQF